MASFDTIFTHMNWRSLVAVAALSAGALIAAPKGLEIYWIDAEGGAATLIVTPSGQSMLIDTANRTPDDRDAKRIFSAARKAGLQKIDILLTTHFHGDHIGAMDALSKMIPIGMYMDYGDSVELNRPQVMANHKAYVERSQGKRRSLQPGDSIPLKGVDIQVMASAGKPISRKLKGAGSKNAACKDWADKSAENDPDNDQSVGILLRYGKFKFLDMSDLSWNYEKNLVCPDNLIGMVDVFQTTHHGLDRSNSPQFVMGDSAARGRHEQWSPQRRSAGRFRNAAEVTRLGDIWQGHLALSTPKEVNTDEKMIANFEPTAECKGNLLELSVAADGKYTITNERNGFSKTYAAK